MTKTGRPEFPKSDQFQRCNEPDEKKKNKCKWNDRETQEFHRKFLCSLYLAAGNGSPFSIRLNNAKLVLS